MPNRCKTLHYVQGDNESKEALDALHLGSRTETGMGKENQLAKKAKQAAKSLGHKLSSFRYGLLNGRTVGNSRCLHCGMEVMIDTYPQEHTKEIIGDAVELNCC
jgi:hypothetical protein